MKHLTCIDPASVFTFKEPSRTSRNITHSMTLVKPAKQLQIVFNSFFYRAIDAWNSLTVSEVEASSVKIFKSSINNIDFKSFLHGSCWN